MARPQVYLNCATSLDGRMAAPGGRPVKYSDDEDLQRVHRMRAACDAILVGVGTVLADDPSLRVKPHLASGPDPMRVILDTRLRTPAESKVLFGGARTLLVHGPDAKPRSRRVDGADSVGVPADKSGLDLGAVLDELGRRSIRTVMVEGGAAVLRSFLHDGLWDRFTLYQAPWLQGGDGPALGPPGSGPLALEPRKVEHRGAGVLWTFNP